MTYRKFKDATKPLAFTVTQEIIDEAHHLGLSGRQMMGLAIMRSHGAKNAPVVVLGKLASAKLNDEGVIEIGGEDEMTEMCDEDARQMGGRHE